MNTQPDSGNQSTPISKTRRDKRSQSLTRRVMRLVLIPSVALIVLWLVVAVDLVGSGFINREVAVGVQNVSIPAVNGLAALEKERQLSMEFLSHSSTNLQPLLSLRQRVDRELTAMRKAAGPVLAYAPQAVKDRMAKLTGYLDQLPKIRSRIDSNSITRSEVYSFYNNLLDAATRLFGTQARSVPDVTSAQGGIAATNMFRVSDLMSRASSLITVAYASGTLNTQDFLEFSNLVGAYHAQLDAITPNLGPDVQDLSRKLASSDSWKRLVGAENALIAHGAWSHGAPAGLPVTATDWQTLTDQVSNALTKMAVAEATEASNQALSDGNTQLWEAAIGLLAAAAVVAAAILWARRRALLLVDRALLTRLTRLRDEAHTLTDERLPRILRWLREGRRVDVHTELPELDYGEDEIGQVATAINGAQRAAVGAAVKEAEARDSVQAVYLGIARRNQRPLRHVLMQLETWQQEEQDPARMERWFELDHQVTQAQRNVENLIILGGGQPGRRWRHPVGLLDVLRQAISETKQYARVKLEAVPDVLIIGDAVAGIGHLVAEILDNALSFSSPQTSVAVRSEQVGAGLVVEVEDRGLGMEPEAREQANRMLLDAPEFDVMALKDSSQIGFWVIAQLAKALNIRVELRESAYGGVRAIVLLPNTLMASSEHTSSQEVSPRQAPQQALPQASQPQTPQPPAPKPQAPKPQAQQQKAAQRQASQPQATPLAHGRRQDPGDRPVTPGPVRGPGTEPSDVEATMQIPRIDLGTVPERPHADEPAASRATGDMLPRRPHPRPQAPDTNQPGTGRHSQPSGEVASANVSWWDPHPGRSTDAADDQKPVAWQQSADESSAPARQAGRAAGRPPLPQRRPQQHIAAQLRRDGQEEFTSGGDEDTRSPEELRSRFSAFQKGTIDGRRDR